MELRVSEKYKGVSGLEEAAQIVQKCVHCGFCNATCPTYQLLGDERDGPRGRIYLMKSMFEGNATSKLTQLHLDRCLTCRACETTCPSGVRYGRLLEIGRDITEQNIERPMKERLIRFFLRKMLLSEGLFRFVFNIGRLVRPMLPPATAKSIPRYRSGRRLRTTKHSRRMLLLDGCVQPALMPAINAAAVRVLNLVGISAVVPSKVGCCGALSLHLGGIAEAKKFARRNINAWWPEVENGAEMIVITASGCGVTVREYSQLLSGEKEYAEKAAIISSMVRDLCEVVAKEKPSGMSCGNGRRVAFHSPCTLQHGQNILGLVEEILTENGWLLTPVSEGHICCGSAGTYSLLQRKISNQLAENKLIALTKNEPDIIASANIGCLLHLEKRSERPVRHWIELLDPAGGMR